MKKFPHILKVERLLSEPINGFLNPQWSPLSRSGAQVRAILYLTTTATQPPLPPFPFPAKGLPLCRGKPFKPHHFCNKLYEIIALANFCGCFLCKLSHHTLSSFLQNVQQASSQTVVSNPHLDRPLCPFPFYI